MKTKALILLTVFIDVIGIGIVIPVLPFYVQNFSDSALLVTSLIAVFSLCSFISAPVIGSLSDKIGRKPVLIMSIFSTAIGYFVFASANSIIFLFIGRIIDGLMAGNLPIAQSYLLDISKDDKERTANLGLIGAIFGIGFILGPLIGGLLGHYGHTVPFWFVGFLALFNGMMAIFTLPETNTNLSQKAFSINPFKPLLKAVKAVNLRSNYTALLLFSIAVAGYNSIFSIYLRDVFGLNELILGIIFGIVGLVMAINQGLAMKHFWLKYFKEPKLELNMLAMFIFGFILLCFNLFYVFCIALILTTFAQSVLRVIMNSQIVSQSDRTERGEIMGVIASITSIGMVIGPFISGSLYELNTIFPFILGIICLTIAYIVLYIKRKELEKIKLDDQSPIESML